MQEQTSINEDFDKLLKKISPTLKRITYKLGARVNFCGSEDLFQEALLHLWEEFNAGQTQDKTNSYILQNCFFYLKNYIRKKRAKVNLLSMDEIVNDFGQTIADTKYLTDRGSQYYRDSLNSSMLAQTIMNNGLTSREKYMLSFCLEGLTTRQIGLKLGVSHVSVVKMLRTVRRKCIKYLDIK